MHKGKPETLDLQRLRDDREPEITHRKPGTTWGRLCIKPKPTAPPIRKPRTSPTTARRTHDATEAEPSEAGENTDTGGINNRSTPKPSATQSRMITEADPARTPAQA
ncbi:hypothetical protein J2X02_003014 [Pseudoxanthomonas japonensis]|uniref:hypothetical protein n=1 Tax=Pseudoxanthomonas japonensis TaxID=69284 RepID=UPI002864B8E5|nr:hypothetical protein [Pseudoxanthomonas japonensis]MDR7070163.1 hypothetical protein [Pseudoxanthomonas japonensis]